MKSLKLHDICKALDISNDLDITISNVANDITRIDNNTLIFHLNKDIELNLNFFNTLTNCFIITDQPILKNDNLNEQYFIHVLDVYKSYQKFIDYYRGLFNIPIVAITGTCGKTTTKEIVKQILEKKHKIASTKSNINALNYDLSYLLSIDNDTEYGIFETAISYPGNLIEGCNYFKPIIGVITNIGIDHLNGCKTINNYIRSKGEILAGLQYSGTLIINNDDNNIKNINLNPFKGKIITFGIYEDSDYFAESIKYDDNGMEFILKYKSKKYNAFVPGLGKHNVYNALAALAVLSTLGLDLDYCIEQLKYVQFIRSHLEVNQGYNNSVIIDDTWSSNPTSLKAALEVLKDIGIHKTKIFVVGKISYLGEYAKDLYNEIGKLIVDFGVDILITTDSFSKQISSSAKKYGMNSDLLIHCKNNDELQKTLECLLDNKSIVLFKTSMFENTITKVIDQLINRNRGIV